ncbi:MAG TPA: fructosamine kinase family protein [Mycobacteriales bacterium]|nr:fructosamine kinase family protein [Mycobacteriales bacterium]
MKEPVSPPITAAAGAEVASLRPVAGGSICRAWQAVLADGRTVFAKTRAGAPADFFSSEAAGLQWLAEARTVAVPEVIGVAADVLVLPWIEPGSPTRAAAQALGRDLAALHQAGAPSFGAGWPGYLGILPLDNTPNGSWPDFYFRQRIQPYVRMARDSGEFSADDVAVFDRLRARIDRIAGPEEPPARLHGDLWNGNVLWGADGSARLIDPAAHGGHRENDLAMLELFGAPYLSDIRAAYAEVFPLTDGWEDRISLHQLQPLLVHTVHFGGGYAAQALAAARAYLS